MTVEEKVPATRVLVVDDDASIREALVERLSSCGYAVTAAASGRAALERIRRGVDLVLLDLQLPHGDGLSVLRGMREEELDATVIVITAYGTIERAVEALKAGAYDFLQKPFAPGLVEEAVRRAEERVKLRRSQREPVELDEPVPVHDGEPMASLLASLRRAAASAATVLLQGESGTGKEVLARALHRWSPRREGAFVAVNCAALPESLLESELFGHERGAFTGADAKRIGRIEAAQGGTLFLDEIGDTSAAFQAKLLRVLQERSFERVGGSQTVEVDLRVVAATHRDLRGLVAEGRFREDLFYRLHVVALQVPALRERRGDIAPLARHCLRRIARKLGRPALELARETLAVLEGYAWPGNVRELENALERAAVLSEDDSILPEDLPVELVAVSTGPAPTGFHEQVEDFRRRLIAETLERCQGNQTRAARALGLQRTYLARLIRKYGL